MTQLLRHRNVAVRFAILYALAMVICFAAWAVGYAWLPEGILRGRAVTSVLAGDTAAPTVLLEFLRIAAINVAVTVLFIILPNRMLEVGSWPLGYVPVLFWSGVYGLLLGSNSLTLALPDRLAPTLAVLGRSGPYEIASYCLAAAATCGIATARAPHLLSMRAAPIEPRPDWRSRVHWRALWLAVALLLAACWWEAYRIVHEFGAAAVLGA
ncbi:MAG: hypothetical protein BAA04_02275 [Firmicutes bacterium ZCTH02-B6]|nr:MAG: hypothetical protein BAA04_02275 [Firmicutes bacterium ZCTH02-B6]